MSSGYRRYEIFDSSPSSSPCFFTQTSIFKPKTLSFPSFSEELELGFALDLLTPTPFDFFPPPCVFTPSPFDAITDLIQINKQQKHETHLKLTSLSDRLAALEKGFEKIVKTKKSKDLDRKYSWTAEINSTEKDGVDKKYKWTTEIKGGKKEEKNYKYEAEFKGKGKDSSVDRKYIFKATTTPAEKKEKTPVAAPAKKNKEGKNATRTRVVEIEDEPVNQGAARLKQAFAKRGGAGDNGKGKKKELSPQDAAMMIQMSFRAYLIRRSQVLRALRELAVAKAKLKELRALFNNFSFRRHIARDAEERQKFSEKIIVLLLTVDAIEGADLMVRAARRSMVDELEAMLEVVDPQPADKLGSMKRRTFDMPQGGIQKEIAAGVAEVVQMLDEDEKNGMNTYEVCL